jgi:tetratricopeptide (TPR) repeat protein
VNLSSYTHLLTHPETVGPEQAAALEAVSAEFPYFQSARALRLKGLYNQNSFQYNQSLKVTAAFTTDRSVLFDFITSENFRSVGRDQYEKQAAEIHEIEVNASEIVIPETDAQKIERSILTSIRESGTENAGSIEIAAEEIRSVEFPAENPADIEFVPVEHQANETPSEIQTSENTSENAVAPMEIEAEPVIEPDLAPADILSETETLVAENTEINQDVPAIEEKLGIGAPLEFSGGETHSFQEWLQLSRLQPIDRTTPPPPEKLTPEEISERDKKLALIDRFIENNPKIPPVKGEAKTPELSQQDHTHLMTETLARVYLEQKKYQKAIQAYEILILKYPEKSSFFADRISEIKRLQQNIQ